MAFLQPVDPPQYLLFAGATFEMPGYFRLSLTASDDMVMRFARF
jgi:hypothetical protein